jgi:hypothetical protein
MIFIHIATMKVTKRGRKLAHNDPQLCEGGDLKDKSLLNQKC